MEGEMNREDQEEILSMLRVDSVNYVNFGKFRE